MSVRILIGDMRQRLRDLPDASVDSVVCDPPYHLTSIVKRFSKARARNHMHDKHKGDIKAGQYARLSKGFMGQEWDGGNVAFDPATWEGVARVLKPGGHLIAFSGTRTYHRMACAIEDAGFEIRDQLAWVYGSGFPKSHNLGDGWGTALKPAWEPIALCRKPLEGTNLANSGAKHLYAGMKAENGPNPDRWAMMGAAASFFMALLNAPIPRIAVENPIMLGHPKRLFGIPEPTQIIQPWQFGHGETKATCLWLKNLPPLVSTNIVEGREQRVFRMAPGPDRKKDRSRTYEGIAAAMAEQWGGRISQRAAA